MVSAAGEAWADEDTESPFDGDDLAAAATRAARAMEASIRDSGLDWCVLRGGLFYGPGTGYDDDWRTRARAGRLRLPGDGADYVSLVHIADMAEATVCALERWPSRRVLIVADDRPCQWRELFGTSPRSKAAPCRRPAGASAFRPFACGTRARARRWRGVRSIATTDRDWRAERRAVVAT